MFRGFGLVTAGPLTGQPRQPRPATTRNSSTPQPDGPRTLPPVPSEPVPNRAQPSACRPLPAARTGSAACARSVYTGWRRSRNCSRSPSRAHSATPPSQPQPRPLQHAPVRTSAGPAAKRRARRNRPPPQASIHARMDPAAPQEFFGKELTYMSAHARQSQWQTMPVGRIELAPNETLQFRDALDDLHLQKLQLTNKLIQSLHLLRPFSPVTHPIGLILPYCRFR